MAAKPDPLAEALASLQGGSSSGQLKVDAMFAERPQVLDAIRDARRRKPAVSFKAIGKLLTADCGSLVSEGAVKNWCAKEGLD